MAPSRPSRSSSRRSSILKPPKARQALQNVDFNSSSSDSSPAVTKLRRRVSFAEKKHVKEFCDSLEQGTVWDNTYEENDLSNSKLPNVSNGDEKLSELAESKNVMGVDVVRDVNAANINLIGPVEHLPSMGSLRSGACLGAEGKLEMLSLSSKEGTCDLKLQANRMAHNICNPTFLHSLDKENVNSVRIQNASLDGDLMDITGGIPSHVLSTTGAAEPSDTTRNVSMEMTEAVLVRAQAYDHTSSSDRTQYFQDASMDVTEALQSVKTNAPVDTRCARDSDPRTCYGTLECSSRREGDVRNVSMELTGIVARFHGLPVADKECTTWLKERPIVLPNDCETLYDISMEMTEAVNVHGKESHGQQKREGSTIAYDERRIFGDTRGETSKREGEDALSLENASMELTTAILPTLCKTQDNPLRAVNDHSAGETASSHRQEPRSEQSPDVVHDERYDETVLTQVPMEFTEAIGTRNFASRTHSRTEPAENSARIEQIVQTVGVCTVEGVERNLRPQVLTQDVDRNRSAASGGPDAVDREATKIFEDDPVALTAIVGASCKRVAAVSLFAAPHAAVTKQTSYESADGDEVLTVLDNVSVRPEIFHDEQPADIVAVVPSSSVSLSEVDEENTERRAVRGCKDARIVRDHFEADGTIVRDLSMEITRAVSSSRTLPPPEQSQALMGKSVDSSDDDLKHMKTFIGDDVEELETIEPPSFVYSVGSAESSLADVDENDGENVRDVYLNDGPVVNDWTDTVEARVESEKRPALVCDFEGEGDGDDDDDDDDDDGDGGGGGGCGGGERANADVDITRGDDQVAGSSDTSLLQVREGSSSEGVDESADGAISVERILPAGARDAGAERTSPSSDHATGACVLQDGDCTDKDVALTRDPFSLVIAKITDQARRDNCIWNLYYENKERKVFGIAFISNSLLIVVRLADNNTDIRTQVIKEVKIISRLTGDADVLLSMVHKILVERLEAMQLTRLFGSCEEVLAMLECVSQEVILAMDFMFDVKRLNDRHHMEVSRDRVSFLSHTKKMDIALTVTVDLKPFSEIRPDDIAVTRLLGHVKDDDVKALITNIKRDSKFLRRYMNDVRDYVELVGASRAV